jgi:hypothetical protein
MHKHCASKQIFVDSSINRSRGGHSVIGRSRDQESSMHYENVAPSLLPSLLLPCSHCGHRMEITAVAPALYANGTASNDLEDITHTCVGCGATLISTRRPPFSAADAIAQPV